MTFRRGAALTTATTLGQADTSDLGPAEGNGFYRRWPDDLAAVQETGVSDVRITLDWARLQPRPGALADEWVEWFEQLLVAADAIGLRRWVTLHDGAVPRWFDDDGGFGDGDNFTRWWPRWVGLVADRLGDHVDGWVPFVELPPTATRPWLDTYDTLRGDAPVVLSIDPAAVAPASSGGPCDAFGVTASITDGPDRIGQVLRDAAETVDRPVLVSSLHAPDRVPVDVGLDEALDEAVDSIRSTVSAVDDAIADGVDVPVVFVDPAISMPTGLALLLDADRRRSPAGEAFVA